MRVGWFGTGFGILLGLGWISGAIAAERLIFNFGPLEFEIALSDLVTFAQTGEVSRSLGNYLTYLPPPQRLLLQDALTRSVPITPLAMANFLYSSQGELLLSRAGQIVRTGAGNPGFFALRSGLILGAAEPAGFNVLNFLDNLPTDTVRLDTAQGLALFTEIATVIQETDQVLALAKAQSEAHALRVVAEESGDFNRIRDAALQLTQPGVFNHLKTSYELRDSARQRRIPFDLYIPHLKSQGLAVPLVIISHGLGSNRETFAYLASHLVSHGFAIAVVEHVGSNDEQVADLLQGLGAEATRPAEFLDRPWDIDMVWDWLSLHYEQTLDFERVAVIGQSFGGYTALALAGAGINQLRLQAECQATQRFFNLSLSLQCLALELAPQSLESRESRLRAIVAINPVANAILGPQELARVKIPALIIASTQDAIAPAIPEQVRPFEWLGSQDKYLMLLEKGSHFSTLDSTADDIPLPEGVIGPDPAIARAYVKALSLAFLHAHLAAPNAVNTAETGQFSIYAQFLTQEEMPLYLLPELPLDWRQLNKQP
ncbi:MAG: alpha/beta fold hydrolase [Cyanobacteria bacterium P01_H01_bin.15]